MSVTNTHNRMKILCLWWFNLLFPSKRTRGPKVNQSISRRWKILRKKLSMPVVKTCHFVHLPRFGKWSNGRITTCKWSHATGFFFRQYRNLESNGFSTHASGDNQLMKFRSKFVSLSSDHYQSRCPDRNELKESNNETTWRLHNGNPCNTCKQLLGWSQWQSVSIIGSIEVHVKLKGWVLNYWWKFFGSSRPYLPSTNKPFLPSIWHIIYRSRRTALGLIFFTLAFLDISNQDDSFFTRFLFKEHPTDLLMQGPDAAFESPTLDTPHARVHLQLV